MNHILRMGSPKDEVIKILNGQEVNIYPDMSKWHVSSALREYLKSHDLTEATCHHLISVLATESLPEEELSKCIQNAVMKYGTWNQTVSFLNYGIVDFPSAWVTIFGRNDVELLQQFHDLYPLTSAKTYRRCMLSWYPVAHKDLHATREIIKWLVEIDMFSTSHNDQTKRSFFQSCHNPELCVAYRNSFTPEDVCDMVNRLSWYNIDHNTTRYFINELSISWEFMESRLNTEYRDPMEYQILFFDGVENLDPLKLTIDDTYAVENVAINLPEAEYLKLMKKISRCQAQVWRENGQDRLSSEICSSISAFIVRRGPLSEGTVQLIGELWDEYPDIFGYLWENGYFFIKRIMDGHWQGLIEFASTRLEPHIFLQMVLNSRIDVDISMNMLRGYDFPQLVSKWDPETLIVSNDFYDNTVKYGIALTPDVLKIIYGTITKSPHKIKTLRHFHNHHGEILDQLTTDERKNIVSNALNTAKNLSVLKEIEKHHFPALGTPTREYVYDGNVSFSAPLSVLLYVWDNPRYDIEYLQCHSTWTKEWDGVIDFLQNSLDPQTHFQTLMDIITHRFYQSHHTFAEINYSDVHQLYPDLTLRKFIDVTDFSIRYLIDGETVEECDEQAVKDEIRYMEKFCLELSTLVGEPLIFYDNKVFVSSYHGLDESHGARHIRGEIYCFSDEIKYSDDEIDKIESLLYEKMRSKKQHKSARK